MTADEAAAIIAAAEAKAEMVVIKRTEALMAKLESLDAKIRAQEAAACVVMQALHDQGLVPAERMIQLLAECQKGLLSQKITTPAGLALECLILMLSQTHSSDARPRH